MPSIFAISDTWFNRLLVDEPNENVVDNNEHIIQVWNENVNPDDEIYVLGGFGIGDLYHILIRLNGKIHFLDNYFNKDERSFMNSMKDALNRSSDQNIKERITFENGQIVILKDIDVILSYFPLEDWPGRSSGTYCFHGMTEDTDLMEHYISCVAKKWEFAPVNIINVQNNINSFNSAIEI